MAAYLYMISTQQRTHTKQGVEITNKNNKIHVYTKPCSCLPTSPLDYRAPLSSLGLSAHVNPAWRPE